MSGARGAVQGVPPAVRVSPLAIATRGIGHRSRFHLNLSKSIEMGKRHASGRDLAAYTEEPRAVRKVTFAGFDPFENPDW